MDHSWPLAFRFRMLSSRSINCTTKTFVWTPERPTWSVWTLAHLMLRAQLTAIFTCLVGLLSLNRKRTFQYLRYDLGSSRGDLSIALLKIKIELDF
eukprot:jgi/Mesvir1/20015/Mv25402-RA.1